MKSRYTEAEIARARARYRPQRIRILFVGESPPSNGNFFYCGNNDMLRHMRSAAGATSDSDDIFSRASWPAGAISTTSCRRPWTICRDRSAREYAGTRATIWRLELRSTAPLAIVSVLRWIKHVVEAAADEAGSSAPRHAVPFPGHGHQRRFQEQVARILSQSP